MCTLEVKRFNFPKIRPAGSYLSRGRVMSQTSLTFSSLRLTLCASMLEHSTIPRSAHTVYLYVFCGSQNKQRLFPYTILMDWFL